MLSIALDYDDTYSADPEFWENFLQLAENCGHNVFIVTYRDERYDFDRTLSLLKNNGTKVYFTRGVAKQWWMEQFSDETVNIWIDDKPEAILFNSSFHRKDLLEWRKDCQRVSTEG